MYGEGGDGGRRGVQDANYAFYQVTDQTASTNGYPRSPPPPPPPPPRPTQQQPQHEYGKYAYDGGNRGAWSQYGPPSPHNYSPNHAALHTVQPQQSQQHQPMQALSQAMTPQQNVSTFYNAQWETQAPLPPPPQQHQQAPLPRTPTYAPNGRHSTRPPQVTPMSPTAMYNTQRQQAPAPQRQQQDARSFNTYAPAAPAPPQVYGGLQNAMPLMMAGMQLATGAAAGGGGGVMNNANDAAALGRQFLQTVAPGAAEMLRTSGGRDAVQTFMRLPKYYFAVNHRYVRQKLVLLLRPWGQRTWVRQRAVHPNQFGAAGGDGNTSYLPPREDVNAPDLYIPLMALATYVLLAGLVLGVRRKFRPQALAQTLSKGGGVLALEVAVVKLGLYLVNARAPWLDVVAFRGYKFVGVALATAITIVAPKAYWPVLFYAASAMGLFLMRSHRRIVLAREGSNNQAELARRNAFLLFLCALQYPIYWLLVLY